VHEIEALLGRQAVDELDLEALEMAVRQQALQLAARAVEPRLNADPSDNAGPRLPCRCGGEARYAGRRGKHFHSVLGPLRLERAYYHCCSCGGGFCPRDRSLGLENSSLSPAVTRMVGTVGALVSFQEGSALLQELAGVAVDAKQVERTAEALGAEIAADERQDTEPANRHRMRYPDFHARGLCTSTGVVEAGCKVAIGTRLKRAGMHWTLRGSNAIIALRCCKLSGRFQDFWERRSTPRTA
jgi:hypothetical protein